MNFRNLFPRKIALRLIEFEQGDMVLGDGARDRGVSPIPELGGGVEYVPLDGLCPLAGGTRTS
ncbi:hypothetical protein [Sphaerisporangium sp. NPDC051011]|uniref:hypothetical protein n=1 Tax=Sphaerisporangium sp. NPDC051011 TaxID=3155792 RepID=UPI0033F7DE8E